MSGYTQDDFLEAEDVDEKVHICLHLIKDYEIQVQIPMLAKDEIPIEYLEYVNYSSHLQAEGFITRYDVTVADGAGQMISGSVGPLVLCGLYEGFIFLLAGHTHEAVPTSVIMAYGQMLVATARPFFGMLGGCEL